jgi:hypothetical protein
MSAIELAFASVIIRRDVKEIVALYLDETTESQMLAFGSFGGSGLNYF